MDKIAEISSIDRFEADAERVLTQVRRAVGRIIDALPGRPERPTAICRALDLDKSLGWKVARFLDGADPFAAAAHLPGPGGWDIVLTRAQRAGVPGRLVADAQSAIADLDALIEQHAGDRASFDVLLAGCTRSGRAQAELSHRRSAFRANSFIWGAQARTQVSIKLLQPSDDGRSVDIARVTGFVGLRRMRPDVPWVISRTAFVQDESAVRSTRPREPIDPEAGGNGSPAPLLSRFCSEPLPRIRRVVTPNGFVEAELIEAPIGAAGEVSCLIGEVSRALAPRYAGPTSSRADLVAHVRTPCEGLIEDLLVRRDTFGPLRPELGIYSELGSGVWYPDCKQDRYRLPTTDVVQRIRGGAMGVRTAEIPRYADLIPYLFERLGWDADRFDLYRARIAYPIIPSAAIMSFDLPSQGR